MNKYDVVDFAPRELIDERPRWCVPHKSYIAYERKYWGNTNIDGLWFDAVNWRRWTLTKLTTTPLIKMEDIKPMIITKEMAEIGKFKFSKIHAVIGLNKLKTILKLSHVTYAIKGFI